ncbi:type III-B CRISPR module RAMP protein Cmr6 [candidate division KSB1 bacterium]|nr:type III-B CRISPR module RAMP protein Cmr6 [candidate division KSB1 bacterium]
MSKYVYTTLDKILPFGFKKNRSSPCLYYHKFMIHEGENKKGEIAYQIQFLNDIAAQVQKINETEYPKWYDRYLTTLHNINVQLLGTEFETTWRLISGMGSNPALETGLYLHHLYGFPYIPGSVVKGVLHHVAEKELMENIADVEIQTLNEDLLQTIEQSIAKAELIRVLFGSLRLEKDEKNPAEETPKVRFAVWKNTDVFNDNKENGMIENLLSRMNILISDNHTGGLCNFFDAVPQKTAFAHSEKQMLQTDIINPHYPAYYNAQGGEAPPSDDQSPIPNYFLAIKPGTKFDFPINIKFWPRSIGRDDGENERVRILHEFTEQSVLDKLSHWLELAFSLYGVGAKTSAGYGYFNKNS